MHTSHTHTGKHKYGPAVSPGQLLLPSYQQTAALCMLRAPQRSGVRQQLLATWLLAVQYAPAYPSVHCSDHSAPAVASSIHPSISNNWRHCAANLPQPSHCDHSPLHCWYVRPSPLPRRSLPSESNDSVTFHSISNRRSQCVCAVTHSVAFVKTVHPIKARQHCYACHTLAAAGPVQRCAPVLWV